MNNIEFKVGDIVTLIKSFSNQREYIVVDFINNTKDLRLCPIEGGTLCVASVKSLVYKRGRNGL